MTEEATGNLPPFLVNEVTGVEYRGGNLDRLASATEANGYDVNHGWAGFHQWIGAGRVVKRGEHGVKCLTVVTVEKAADDSGRQVRKPRGFVTFHWSQTEELQSEGAAQ